MFRIQHKYLTLKNYASQWILRKKNCFTISEKNCQMNARKHPDINEVNPEGTFEAVISEKDAGNKKSLSFCTKTLEDFLKKVFV